MSYETKYNHKVVYTAHYLDQNPEIHDMYQFSAPSKLEDEEIEKLILKVEKLMGHEVSHITLLKYEVTPA